MNFTYAFRMLPALILALGTVHAANGFVATGSSDQSADDLSGLSAALESGHGMGLGDGGNASEFIPRVTVPNIHYSFSFTDAVPPAVNLTYARQKFRPVPEVQSMVLMVLGVGMVIFALRRRSPA